VTAPASRSSGVADDGAVAERELPRIVDTAAIAARSACATRAARGWIPIGTGLPARGPAAADGDTVDDGSYSVHDVHHPVLFVAVDDGGVLARPVDRQVVADVEVAAGVEVLTGGPGEDLGVRRQHDGVVIPHIAVCLADGPAQAAVVQRRRASLERGGIGVGGGVHLNDDGRRTSHGSGAQAQGRPTQQRGNDEQMDASDQPVGQSSVVHGCSSFVVFR
jgi:hypothetical protein